MSGQRETRYEGFAEYLRHMGDYVDSDTARAYQSYHYGQSFGRSSPPNDWGDIPAEVVTPEQLAWFERRSMDPRPYITQRQIEIAFERSVAATVIEATGRVVR